MPFLRRSTTAIIGEIIALTTEVEDCVSMLGKEGYELFKMSRINDDTTLEVCRKVEMAVRGALRTQKKMKYELDDTIDATRSRCAKVFGWFLGSYVISKDTKILREMLRESCDELGERMIYLQIKDPGALTTRMSRIVNAIGRMRRELDNDWAELNARTKAGSKFSVIAIFNLFIVNLFKYSNKTIFKTIVNRVIFFSHVALYRVHRQVESELDLPASAVEAEGQRMTQEAIEKDSPKKAYGGHVAEQHARAAGKAGAKPDAGIIKEQDVKKAEDIGWKPIVKGRKGR